MSVSINKNKSSKDYIIKIRDNGVGREAIAKLSSNAKKSFGIKISSECLKNFNRSTVDQIQIHDLKDDKGQAEGTLVVIKIRYK